MRYGKTCTTASYIFLYFLWLDFLTLRDVVGVHRIPKEEAALLPNKTAAIPGDPDGYYIAELEVFHQLHCLVRLNLILPSLTLTNFHNTSEHDQKSLIS